tara:strand:+ start:61 stop:381 length:321 start_codon:yes stop_codon:yes gene_type:complete
MIKEGDLVKISNNNGWTICLPKMPAPQHRTLIDEYLKERMMVQVGNTKYSADNKRYRDLDGEFGLITKVIRNKIDQTTAYEVMIDGRTMRVKGIVGDKYFHVVGGN